MKIGNAGSSLHLVSSRRLSEYWMLAVPSRQVCSIRLSREFCLAQTTLGDLKLECCLKLGLEEGDVQLHDYWERRMPTHANLEADPDMLDRTVSTLHLYHNQDVLLMEKVWESPRLTPTPNSPALLQHGFIDF